MDELLLCSIVDNGYKACVINIVCLIICATVDAADDAAVNAMLLSMPLLSRLSFWLALPLVLRQALPLELSFILENP